MNAETAPICPRCGQLDAVRKVSSIVQEGVSVGSYETYYPGQIAGKPLTVPVKKEMVSKTILAQKLTLPSSEEHREIAKTFYPPPKTGIGTSLLWVITVLLMLSCAISALIFAGGFFFGGEEAATRNVFVII